MSLIVHSKIFISNKKGKQYDFPFQCKHFLEGILKFPGGTHKKVKLN